MVGTCMALSLERTPDSTASRTDKLIGRPAGELLLPGSNHFGSPDSIPSLGIANHRSVPQFCCACGNLFSV